MKLIYKQLMHVACGQSIALEKLDTYLNLFDSYITKYENTDDFNEENVRGFLHSIRKATKTAIKDNNKLIELTDDLKN